MNDPFMDIFLNKIKSLKLPEKAPRPIEIPMSPLPEPKEGEAVGVDGGSGAARLAGRSFRVARAVAIGDSYLDKDLELEVSRWDSSAALEALRSSVELALAVRSPKRTFVDGSAYTALSKWVTRVVRVARGRAKLSEILALPKTLLALSLLEELNKREDVAFVAKSPMVKFFSEYLAMKKDQKLFERYVRGRISPKEMREIAMRRGLVDYAPDLEAIEGEGVSFGLRLGLLEPLRNLIVPSRWKAVLEMALENYKIYAGEEYEGPLPKDLCFVKAPVAWWASYGRWKVLVEEFGDKPLCLARYREEVRASPKALPYLLGGAGSTYNAWLALAHSLSTLRGEHLIEYLKLLSVETGLGLDEIREELIYVM